MEDKHFITDAAYRSMVERDFEQKKQLLAEAPENLWAVFDGNLTMEEKEALEFLYAYSPLIDLSVYGGDFLLENVRLSLKVRDEMPWGKNIPETVFRHFVLPVRAHNESLDSSRCVFYHELRERVMNCKTMEEAALEVNHWCHEKAVYRPTNARTCSPLSMVSTAYGRCGEESIFTLAAMRSVGIPARQVYTPRWAHCDDNHAWVEVWVDGVWKYLGACEPEPRLNIAWFTAPVRRGLYMEARVFGRYADEEVVDINANLTRVNVTGNYTDAKRVVVKVVDTEGKSVPGAWVEYKIYNYGEYYPAVSLTSDSGGISSLTVGLGDWIVWAGKEECYGFCELEAATMDTVVVMLDKKGKEVYRNDFDLIPPVEKEYQALTGDEERAENDRRFMYEDSVRNAYIGTFMSEEDARRKAEEWGYESWYTYVEAARGNSREIVLFLEMMKDAVPEQKYWAVELLKVLTEKDLQDITATVLADQLTGALKFRDVSGEDKSLFRDYVLNPRVKNEYITAYRQPLRNYLKTEHVTTPVELLAAMKRIKVIDSVNTIHIATPPVGVLRAMVTDSRSRELFFVTACRTMGIAARLNPVDGQPEYYEKGEWIPVVFEPEQTIGEKGTLMVKNKGTAVKDPVYYTHFTLSKIEDGKTHLIDLGSNAQVDMGGGLAYSRIFNHPVELEEGQYVLVTGNRKSDGSVRSEMTVFQMEAGKNREMDMLVREVRESLNTLGVIHTKVRFVPENEDMPRTLVLPEKGYTALAIIAADKEPVNHLVRDMSAMKADFEGKGIPFMFLFENEEQLNKFSRRDFRPLPETMMLGYDYEGEVLNSLRESLDLKNTDHLPLLVMVNRRGEIVYLSQGYRIGLGNQIMKYMGF